ncbi:hypothetical protein J4Q44_G00253970, partial [Coregonus suidteri]
MVGPSTSGYVRLNLSVLLPLMYNGPCVCYACLSADRTQNLMNKSSSRARLKSVSNMSATACPALCRTLPAERIPCFLTLFLFTHIFPDCEHHCKIIRKHANKNNMAVEQ